MKIFSHFVSWVFLPLLMPIYGLIIVMYVPSVEQSFFQENTLFWMPNAHKIAVLTLFFVFSFLAPGISIFMLKKSNVIATIEMDDRKDRKKPIILTAVYALVLNLFLWIKAPENLLPKIIYALPWAGLLCTIIAGIITKYDKISLHGMGVGMFFSFLCYYYNTQVEFYFEIIVIAILVSGLVMSARLYLHKHTLKQVINGFFLGFFGLLFTCYFFNLFF
jgi:membrane-associated phospholipid phosphatase